jgi:hypothetical protein
MKRTRQVLVMTLVATALCADRVATAAPAPPAHEQQPMADPIARLASHLGSKLTCAFRRVVTETRLSPVRRDGMATPSPVAPRMALPATIHVAESSPFQFRLPPPTA